MNLVEIGIIVGIISSACLGIFSFYKYFLKWKLWKPNVYLNNGRLVFINDSKKEIIIIKITAVSNNDLHIAKQIRTKLGKEIQKTNIIYPNQFCEIEFDIDDDNFNSGIIIIEYQFDGNNKEYSIDLSDSDKVYFINNRRVRFSQR